MDFGVVLQTNPPAWRTVQLAELSEAHGFDYVWTFDSHLLWQEPYVIYSQILARTNRVMVGPMVTNPATRDWTVTASLFATLDVIGQRLGNLTRIAVLGDDVGHMVADHTAEPAALVPHARPIVTDVHRCRHAEGDRVGVTSSIRGRRTHRVDHPRCDIDIGELQDVAVANLARNPVIRRAPVHTAGSALPAAVAQLQATTGVELVMVADTSGRVVASTDALLTEEIVSWPELRAAPGRSSSATVELRGTRDRKSVV